MARIRTIKPDFWTDEKTGMLSDAAKVLFIGLLNFADDYGVLEFRPLELCARILPFRKGSVDDALSTPLDNELLRESLVRRFDYHGKTYLWIVNFLKHQHINRPSKPLLAGWGETTTPESFCDTHGGPIEHSLSTPVGREWKGREWKGREGRGEGALVRATLSPVSSPQSSTSASLPPAPATAPAGPAPLPDQDRPPGAESDGTVIPMSQIAASLDVALDLPPKKIPFLTAADLAERKAKLADQAKSLLPPKS